ncbi:Serine protease htra2, mitochondrial [Thoreauomyces humboldtii]|nr:Serine protease htra2, mitochondrial [Thoreauomyces humboldtii]
MHASDSLISTRHLITPSSLFGIPSTASLPSHHRTPVFGTPVTDHTAPTPHCLINILIQNHLAPRGRHITPPQLPRRPVLIEEDSGDDDDDACVASDLDEAFSARTRTVTKSVKRKEEKGSADRKHSFIADAVEKAMGAVVNISVETETSTLLHKNSLISSGSGFFIDADGSILTNAHVVTDMGPGGTLTVTTSDGAHYPGRIHSLDTLSDLAVVKIAPRTRAPSDPPTTSGTASATSWPVLQMSTNIDLRRGDWVVAIGSPFGLHNTVTAGVVSSHRRRSDEIGYLGVPGPNTTEHHQSDAHPVEYIQTDCVVHEGSSGGPLLNLDGDVVGINTTRAESEGISFAIRADNAMELVHQLNTQGRVVRPFLGARMVSLSAHVRQQLRDQVPSRPSHGRSAHATPPSIHQDHGVLVTTVLPDAPCARAGMMDGDVVVAVNGRPCHSTRELYAGVGSEMKEAIFSVRRNVPLDMDWDGRSTRWETLELEIGVKPEELDG